MLTAARALAGTVLAGLALAALGGCSQGHQPGRTAAEPPVSPVSGRPSIPTSSGAVPASPTAASRTTATNATAVATGAPARQKAAAQRVPLEPAALPSLSAVPAVPAGFTEACAPAALLAYVNTQDGPATGFGQVTVYDCVGGYARLHARANPAPSGEQPEGDQFFLRYGDGRWKTLARGVGIGCGDRLAVLAQACAVLDFAATH
jgi:hypothetical protein